MTIFVLGSFMMDLVVRSERAPGAGETVVGDSFGRFPGGKGANQAVAVARLGGAVAMAGKLGGDAFGGEFREVLEREGVDAANVLEDDAAPTGVGMIVVERTGQNRIIVVPGANMAYAPDDLDGIEPIIARSRMLVMQLEMKLEVVEKAAAIARSYGVPTLLNPAPARPLGDELLRNVTYLTPNESELELLTGRKLDSLEDVREAARTLRERGVENVVVTLAEKGALVSTADETEHVAGFVVAAVDTVAAGDSFNGALALELVRGKPLREAVAYANAVGALTVTRPGAIPSLPTKGEVERFLSASYL